MHAPAIATPDSRAEEESVKNVVRENNNTINKDQMRLQQAAEALAGMPCPDDA
jgi:hypothetical protein